MSYVKELYARRVLDSTSHMDSRDERLANVSLGATILVGATSFFISFCGFGLAGVYAGFVQLALFNPNSEQSTWVMPTIFCVSVAVAIIAAWLVYRLLRNRLIGH